MERGDLWPVLGAVAAVALGLALAARCVRAIEDDGKDRGSGGTPPRAA